MSKAITVVGANEQGKSTYVKNILKTLPCPKHILDIGGEHNDVQNATSYIDMKEFEKHGKQITNSAIFIDEATLFLANNRRLDFMLWLYVRRSKRHNNNMIFTSFHSVQLVPRDVIRFSNYLVLFPTSDIPEDVHKKLEGFPQAIQAYDAGNPQRFNPVIIEILSF